MRDIKRQVEISVADTYTPISSNEYDYEARNRVERLATILGFVASKLPEDAQKELADYLDELDAAQKARARRIWNI